MAAALPRPRAVERAGTGAGPSGPAEAGHRLERVLRIAAMALLAALGLALLQAKSSAVRDIQLYPLPRATPGLSSSGALPDEREAPPAPEPASRAAPSPAATPMAPAVVPAPARPVTATSSPAATAPATSPPATAVAGLVTGPASPATSRPAAPPLPAVARGSEPVTDTPVANLTTPPLKSQPAPVAVFAGRSATGEPGSAPASIPGVVRVPQEPPGTVRAEPATTGPTAPIGPTAQVGGATSAGPASAGAASGGAAPAVTGPGGDQLAGLEPIPGALRDGAAAYRAGEFRRAAAIWLPLAQAGNARAQFQLGALLAEGRMGGPDDVNAYVLLSRAATRGIAAAGAIRDEVAARLGEAGLATARARLGNG